METTHTHSHLADISGQTGTRIVISLVITLGFVLIEGIAGYWANSLALLTDAVHNLTDVFALALSWHAIRLAARPANPDRTYGYHRAGILVALFNSTTLVVIALGIFYEAYHRLLAPEQVQAETLTLVATIAFLVNAGTAWIVRHGSENDLNLRSVFVHLAGDAISTGAAIVAGIGIVLTHWNWLDPLVSVFIGVLILWNGWGIIRETVNILMEATPRGVDLNEIIGDMLLIDGVLGVHDLHVWSITQTMRSLSAHLAIDDISISESIPIRDKVYNMLYHKYAIAHATLQFECVDCDPMTLYCDLEQANQRYNK
ncbi:MAG: cation transporter [Chloroflexi bacterium]|nr:cation transporter [Chloroflexota bacterium]